MEQTTILALERISNPILTILLGVLMIAIVALWLQYQSVQKRLYELAIETVGALKDTNTRLANIGEELEQIKQQHEKN